MLLTVTHLAKSFGSDIVLGDVSFRVDSREKVALVGRNGCGKSTLLKIITGELGPDSGTVTLGPGVKLGFLRQDLASSADRTVLEEAQAGREAVLALKTRIAELEIALEEHGRSEDLDEYAMLHEHLEDSEGYALEHDVEAVLRRMGFSSDEFSQSTSTLSGGQRTRLGLARLLLEEPDLLLLDEPTNHLDLEATSWLESWVRAYHGAVLLVSHDRRFLEATAGRVVEMRGGQTKSYLGGYEQYLRLRAEDEARQAEVAAQQAREVEKLDEFVRRFMNSQRTAQARGRLKRMESLKARQVTAPVSEVGIAAGFKKSERSGDIVIQAKSLVVGYDGVGLAPPLDWTVRYLERWGVIGENGAGKSTLVRTLLGRLDPVAGEGRLGARVSLGYFSQGQDALDPNRSPLEHLVQRHDMDVDQARNLLARFLLVGDDVFRPIRSLSGGERNKLVLAEITQASPNLLVLDEPTNHLDIDSREALASVIQQFIGTLVLVSHDRWLLEQTTTMTLDFRRSGAIAGPRTEPMREPQSAGRRTGASSPSTSDNISMSPRELSKLVGRTELLLADHESAVALAESQLRALEGKLASPEPGDDLHELSKAHESLSAALENAFIQWHDTGRQLEALREQQVRT